MKKQSTNRQYNFPDADLYVMLGKTLRRAKRDEQEFQAYGFGAEKYNSILTRMETFGALPNDDEMVGEQMVKTSTKNEAAKAVRSAIRSLMTRVAMRFNNRTGQYRKFGTARLGDMSDAQLLFCGRRAARVARNMQSTLETYGVNDVAIERVLESCRKFEIALNVQQDYLHDRDIAVDRRVKLGNQLYQDLVTLSDIGKDIWAESDRVKYDEYVIYETRSKPQEAA